MRLAYALASTLSALLVTADTEVFSHEDLVSAPRPQPARANPNGSYAVSAVDRWDPKADKTTRSVYLLKLASSGKTQTRHLFDSAPGAAGSFLWLDDATLAYLNGTELYALPVSSKGDSVTLSESKVILNFPKGINPDGITYNADSGILAFSGQVWEDGSFDNVHKWDESYEGRGTTGVVFDELFLRHWDTWRTPGKAYTVGTVKLAKSGDKYDIHSQPEFRNILNDTGLYSQMDPMGSVSVSSSHIAFSVKAPHLDVARHTRLDIYLLSTTSRSSPKHITPHHHGAISSVVFSPDGKKLAWLEMAEDGYEADRNVVKVYDVKSGKTVTWTEKWDRSPSSLTWALDSDSLYFTAEHHGRILPYHLTHPNHLPTPLDFNGSTSSIQPLSKDTLLISKSSFTSPQDAYILTLSDELKDNDKLPHKSLEKITNWSEKHLDGRLDEQTGEEFWFKGADEWDVMGWAIKPRGWKEGDKKKWPLAFLVHGGPQGSWEDNWSTRWNPALFASQGYFVVAINPTGSTGYGQEFCDKIGLNWGGAPFKDLLAGYHHVLEKYPEIDPERTAMLGASYGGYMANWIQGHNDQFGFKAIVCHDGIFNTINGFYTTEELWFAGREFGGDPTESRLTYEKWNPMNHVSEWKTPELVIHSGKDFRLVDGEGIAAFTALQVQGVPSRFLYFPDENHWVLKPQNSIKWHHEVFRWLHEWVGKENVMEMEGGRLVIQKE